MIIAKCLVRIRTTTENYIYFTQPSDMAGLALAFRRDNSTTCSGNTNVLWVYPETVDYLPEELFDSPIEAYYYQELIMEMLMIWEVINIILIFKSGFN